MLVKLAFLCPFLYIECINILEIDIQNPGSYQFYWHTPCNGCSIITLNRTSAYPWAVLTKNTIYHSDFNIVCIANSGTNHLLCHQQTIVFYIISYHVCVSAETVTISHIIIQLIPKSRLLFNPDAIALCPLHPLYWSMGINFGLYTIFIIPSHMNIFSRKLEVSSMSMIALSFSTSFTPGFFYIITDIPCLHMQNLWPPIAAIYNLVSWSLMSL